MTDEFKEQSDELLRKDEWEALVGLNSDWAAHLLADRLREARRELAWLRSRAFNNHVRLGSKSHSTACTIWGDDGQGNTREDFEQPLSCNCGALCNFERDAREKAEAELAEERQRVKMYEAINADLHAALCHGRRLVEAAEARAERLEKGIREIGIEAGTYAEGASEPEFSRLLAIEARCAALEER